MRSHPAEPAASAPARIRRIFVDICFIEKALSLV
jgi:hypothetical protein